MSRVLRDIVFIDLKIKGLFNSFDFPFTEIPANVLHKIQETITKSDDLLVQVHMLKNVTKFHKPLYVFFLIYIKIYSSAFT